VVDEALLIQALGCPAKELLEASSPWKAELSGCFSVPQVSSLAR